MACLIYMEEKDKQWRAAGKKPVDYEGCFQ